MSKKIILDILERELEQELQIKHESDNQDIIKELILAYQFFNNKHFTTVDKMINLKTLHELIKKYKEV